MRVAESLEQMLEAQAVVGRAINWPLTSSGDERGKDAREIAQNQFTILSGATPFFWSGRCSEFVATAAEGLDMAEIIASPELLHVDRAWFWFECPRFTVNIRGERRPVVAVSAAWVKFQGSQDEAMIVAGFCRENGHPIPCMSTFVRAGESLAASVDPSSAVDGDFTADMTPVIRFVAAAGAFLRTKAPLSATSERVDRHARKRLARQGYTGDEIVKVITLRARERSDSVGAGESDVDWSHRWIVTGHWRQQWYPSVERHLPLWIHPFVKGPEDKPLKASGRPVMVVSR